MTGHESPPDQLAAAAYEFRAVYESVGMYDEVLPPHYYGGRRDDDIVAEFLDAQFGPPSGGLAVLELGCGTGRVTARLAPHARRLAAVDSSAAMLTAFRARFPAGEAEEADIRSAVTRMLRDGRAGEFDLVGAFWSLNYVLGEFFEDLTPSGIQPAANLSAANEQACAFVCDLVSLVAENGHLLALFFDADTPEQRLVTWAWERIAPFPPGGRGYTRLLLLDELRAAEDRGHGHLTHTRAAGVAVAPSVDAAMAWFNHLHFKDLPALTHDPEVQAAVTDFVSARARRGGEVILPSGIHVIDFKVSRDPTAHLPSRR